MVSVLTTIALIIIGVLLFELIIFFHEGGHFLAAKRSGVQVNEFALGMGPKLFSFTRGETTYSLRAFPIGGYCAMEGEDEDSDNPRAFNNAKVWKRMIIIVAGAFMNIVLGLIMMFVIVIQTPYYSSTTVSSFPQTSFSANCGLQSGDTITKVNNYRILTSQDIQFALYTSKCKEVDGDTLSIYKQDCAMFLCNLYVDFYNEEKANYSEKQITKAYNLLTEGAEKINAAADKSTAEELAIKYGKKIEKAVGTSEHKALDIEVKETRQRYQMDLEVLRNGKKMLLKDVQFYTYLKSDDEQPAVSLDFYVEPIEKNIGTVLTQTGLQTTSVARMVWATLIGLVRGEFSIKDVSGPVGVASAVTQVASKGLETGFLDAVNNIVYVMLLISVNLGIFNMLPFPALDGGRFVFLLIETIFRRPIPRKVEGIVNGAGLVLLLALSALIALKDIWQLLPFGG
ncbi:MAG: RIP metalloprotease RseP [Ruminococcus sp.]|nr:RIP metalloprotease RseP [Ruminococcus sp.]